MPSRTAGALRVVAVLAAIAGIAAWFLTRATVGETRVAEPPSPAAAAPSERPESQTPRLPQLPPPAASSIEELAAPAVPEAAPTTGLIVEVRDTHGVPLEGMFVHALLLPAKEVEVKATTAADGAAWLDCEAGSYYIGAVDLRADGRYSFASLDAADVAATGPTRVTLTVIEATGRVEVFVHDDTGAPVANVQLDGSGRAPKRGRGERYTDAAGMATWEPVVAGGWSVSVESTKPGSGLIDPDGLEAYLVVEPTGTTRHEFVLARLGVVIARLADIPNGSQIAGMTIHSERQREERRLEMPPDLIAEPIEFTWHLPPGEHVLTTEWRPDSPWWSPPQTVTVEPGLVTYVSVDGRPCQARIAGHVRDTAGLAVAGVAVWIIVEDQDISGDREDWMNRAHQELASKIAYSGADGEWSIEVPAGVMQWVVNTRTPSHRHLARFEDDTERIDLTRPIEIVVAPGCIVGGHVEGHWAEQAAAGGLKLAIVHEQAADREAGQRRTKLAQDATFTFEHMGSGSYSAVLMRDGDAVTDTIRFEIPADFEEGATIPVTLNFPE